MDKVYDNKKTEAKIYKEWEEKGLFKPEINPKGKPYTIILPPPNANGALHFGHAMFTVEDILIRYHRMRGHAALWLPGTDHAGIETQFVFEKKLKEIGKSRFDYDQETLYQMIWDYVETNKGGIEDQLRKLGFSLDWSRRKYTLDKDIVKLVYKTFKKMFDDGLIYRGQRLVNYCTFDGTSFSDLEITYEERNSPLYYIKYGPLVLATTRPETKFGDTAVAVNPKDIRYQQYIGQEIEIETVLGRARIKVIGDESVDPEFGTGAVKITPAHDFNDFEVGKRHNLEMKQVIGFDGKMNGLAGKYQGMYIKQARKEVVQDMQKKGLIDHIDHEYVHRIGLCYKCKNVLEPLPMEQWFIKVKPLAEKAIKVVKKGKIKIYPKSFEAWYFNWLENLRDWNISRQIVWGIRIPAWKNKNTGEWKVTDGEAPPGNDWEQDKDTFDTWFSSGQWPYLTLQTTRSGDFKEFYPTDVMETAYDILRAWVSRMVMLGLYLTDEVPFKNVLFHGLVNDPYGKKMSKSKGNVINPLELIDQYGADAVRFALIYGNATGNDQSLSYSKLDAARKFTNKLWNMARFINMKREIRNSKFEIRNNLTRKQLEDLAVHKNDKEMIERTEKLAQEITRLLDKYDFNHAAQNLYDFIWHEFADKYIEDVKGRIDENSYFILNTLFLILLKLLHPFMPFVTEDIYKTLWGKEDYLMVSNWPSFV
ncbi:MAG: valine--tRNA ligase [Candidatus Levybacteria bacterium CG_4_9_14_3_um_filter_35_16]|nr:MAG: valine--tRNA ligase [Candidatus Levybacteria bacterium CG_4_9_14_3_um_filter_35_16]PJC54246.1 MAG: valine--tRNA ligase [Candidatus Levybacteria bacterium CG_4_9_14_0_2_um_filter_35_21]